MGTPAGHEHNSFDFLRFAAASAVLVGHHAPISGRTEWLIPFTGDTLGGVAVYVFFAISGFLIWQSLGRSSRWNDFFAARLLRIMPNLLFSLTATSIVMMIWFDNRAHLADHVMYVVDNALMMVSGVRYTIPGVLEGRPIPGPNGSLWSLPYELWLYVALFLLYVLGPRRREVGLACAAIAAYSLWMRAEPGDVVPFLGLQLGAPQLATLALYFFSGALVARLWPWIEPRRAATSLVCVACIVASRSWLPFENALFAPAAAALVLIAGSTRWATGYARFGDPSYGMYIFAFPIQQLAVIAIDDYLTSLVVSWLFTTSIGYATWHGFEQRCLRGRAGLARLLALPVDRIAQLARRRRTNRRGEG